MRQVSTPDAPAQLARLVNAALESAPQASDDRHAWERARAFYASREFQPAWWSKDRRDAARVLIERMEFADADGLPAASYAAGRFKARLDGPRDDLGEAVAADVVLTATLLRFASDLAYGVGPDASARDIDVLRLLETARDPQSARDVLASLEPRHVEYRQLRRALRQYRELAARGGWPALPDDTLLRPREEAEEDEQDPEARMPQTSGDSPAAIKLLCERLAVTGDLGSTGEPEKACGFDSGAAPAYTATLERGVRAFQTRHGLVVDGIVGPRTVAALNVPVEDRITQLAINMNRWRRLPDDLGSAHVQVNVAGYYLQVREHGRTILSMRVVAGEPDTPTPVMSDEISYLDFRPYWNVPRSITENELLPKIRKNPAYLRQQRFEVVDGWSESADVVNPASIDWRAAARFPYRLRQLPGPDNSLGLVKFMFPNDYSVYLHDTPATHRFEQRRRAFSHGCVRVEDPVALAEFLLRQDGSWSREAIISAMHGGERQVVQLPEPVPVHLTYFTAWVDGDLVQFRADLYGRDQQERNAIMVTTD